MFLDRTLIYFSKPNTKLTLSICIMYAAYNASLGVGECVFGTLSFTSLTVLYFFYGISSLFVAPDLIFQFGARKVLMSSGIGFLPYYLVRAFLPTHLTLCLMTSMLYGISAGTLWFARGSYSTKLSEEEGLGSRIGFFYMMLQFSQVVGNFLTAVLLRWKATFSTLFFVYGLLSLLGFVMLYHFLSESGAEIKSLEEDEGRLRTKIRGGNESRLQFVGVEGYSMWTKEAAQIFPTSDDLQFMALQKNEEKTRSAKNFLFFLTEHREIRRFLPYVAWNAFSMVLWFTFVPSRVLRPALGMERVGVVMTGVGVADSLSSYLFGAFCDRKLERSTRRHQNDGEVYPSIFVPDAFRSSAIKNTEARRTFQHLPPVSCPTAGVVLRSRFLLLISNVMVGLSLLGLIFLIRLKHSAFYVGGVATIMGIANASSNVFLLYYSSIAFSKFPSTVVVGILQGTYALSASLSIYLTSSLSIRELSVIGILFSIFSSHTYLSSCET